MKDERFTLPLRFVGWLHIEVVVYRNVGTIDAGFEPAYNYRITRCLNLLGLSTKCLDCLYRDIGKTSNLRAPIRFGADPGYLTPLFYAPFNFQSFSLHFEILPYPRYD